MLNNAQSPGPGRNSPISVAASASTSHSTSGLEGMRAPTLKLDEEDRQRVIAVAARQEEPGSPLYAALRTDFISRFSSSYRRVALVSFASVGSIIAGVVVMIGSSPAGGGLLVSTLLSGLGVAGVLFKSSTRRELSSKAKSEFTSSFLDGPLLFGYHYLHVEQDHSRAIPCFQEALRQHDAPATQVRALFGLISVMEKAKQVETFNAALGQITDYVFGLPLPSRFLAPRAQYCMVESIRVVAERMRATRYDSGQLGPVEHPYINERNVRQLLNLLKSVGPLRPVALGMLAELPSELLRCFEGRDPKVREALSELKGAVDVYFAPEQEAPQPPRSPS